MCEHILTLHHDRLIGSRETEWANAHFENTRDDSDYDTTAGCSANS